MTPAVIKETVYAALVNQAAASRRLAKSHANAGPQHADYRARLRAAADRCDGLALAVEQTPAARLAHGLPPWLLAD